MQKKLIATVVASVVAGQTMALEVYNDDASSLSIGGRIGLMVDDSARSVDDDSSRINFRFAHRLTDDLMVVAVQEWGFDAAARSGDDVFSNRLGYFRLDHNELGMLTAGKQYAAYAEIADWGSDMMLFNGGEGVGIYDGLITDGGVHGTGRADDAIGYRNSFGGLNIGLQYQLKDKESSAGVLEWERKDGQQIALSYDLPVGISLGYAYNQTRFKRTTNHNGETAKAHVFGAKFRGDALYVGVNYAEMKHHANTRNQTAASGGNGIAEKASTIDLYASYALDQVADGFSLYSGYQKMDYSKGADGNNSKEEMKIASIGAQYEVGPTLFGVQYDKKDNKDSDGSKVRTDNTISVNARYYF